MCPGFPVPNSPHCLCGRKATLNSKTALTVRRFDLAVRCLVGKKNPGSIPLRLSHTHTDSRQNVTPTRSYSISWQCDTNMIIQQQYAQVDCTTVGIVTQTRSYNDVRQHEIRWCGRSQMKYSKHGAETKRLIRDGEKRRKWV